MIYTPGKEEVSKAKQNDRKVSQGMLGNFLEGTDLSWRRRDESIL
jgi:hypothetical protein